MAKDIITRKDMIEAEVFLIGPDYAKSLQPALDANKQLVESLKQMAPLVNVFRNVANQQAFITAKQQENIITLQAINANKLLESSELSLEKIKKAKLATEKAELDLANKKEGILKKNTKLTLEERVQNEANNKVLKQAARENLGLVGAYSKLNQSRLDAQKRLAELLSAEVKNTAAIIIAQREFDRLDERVKAVDEAIRNYSKNIGNYQSAFEGLGGTLQMLMETFGLVTGAITFGTILTDIFTIIREFDKQLIAVGKTTNLSGEELKQFGRDVVELGDRLDGISVDGLIQSAEVAGQLGVTGTSNILKFSEAIEKLKLTSDIISDEQVGNFAKFIEVSSDSFENADKLASVITRLGNSFATTEAEVLANSTEIQKSIAVYNTSAKGVLGLGAATSTLGSEAEVSGTAIQKTFGIINKAIATGANLEKVLKLTGLTQKELSEQFNKDATGVFQKFVKGLSDAKKEGENLAVVLGDVGIKEDRQFKVIGSLAANYDILKSAMEQAADEYINNIALNKEVAAASESIDSILGDITDRYHAYILATNDANNGTQAITTTLKFFRDNLKTIIDYTIKFGTVLLVYIGVMKTVNFVTTTWAAIQTAATAGQIRFALATGIGTRSILAQAAAAREAAIAQEGLNLAVAATPWGLILAFLSAAIVAYMVFNDEMSDAEKNIQRIVDANKELERSEKFYSDERDKSNSERFKAIENDIKLRKAQGENSDKLDKEEIARKKELLQASLNLYSDIKKEELTRTQTEINSSIQRIAQFKIEQNALKYGNRISKQGRDTYELDELIKTEKEKLDLKKSSLVQNSKLTKEEQARLLKQIGDLDKDAAVKDAEFKTEESKKARALRLKRLKERYEDEKKALDDLFKLQQFRLQVAMDADGEIIENEKLSYDKRLDALYDYTQLASERIRNDAEYQLSQLGKYNEKTGKLVRELSDLEIKTLLEDGIKKENMTKAQLLIFERYQDDQKKLVLKGEKDKQKIIDSEVSSVQKKIDENIKAQDTELSGALEAENIKFKAITDGQANIKKATEEHERQVAAIKELYAKKALQTQVDAIQELLDAEKVRTDGSAISVDKIKSLENDLAKYKLQLSEIGLENYIANSEKRVELEKDAAERIKELSQGLTDALVDLTNTIFNTRIDNIDNEISKSNEYYDKQIELAGNDARQKDLLQKEKEKKEKKLEKERQKEQVKQAAFNKVIALAEIGRAHV